MAKTYQQIMDGGPPAGARGLARRGEGAARRTARSPSLLDVREKEEFRQGTSRMRSPSRAASSRCASRRRSPTRTTPDHRLLRRRHALAARRTHPEGDGLHERRLDERRLQRLEEPGPADHRGPPVHRRAAEPLQPPLPAARGGRGGAGEAARRQGAAASARAGSARRRRSTWRPPASARSASSTWTSSTSRNLQRQILHTNDRVGMPKVESARMTLQALNPDVQGRRVPRAPDLRERVPHLRAVRHHRRRLRQLPDPLPGERRLRDAEEADRPRHHLPVRGPGDGLLPAARAPATAASSRSRRRRARRRPAPRRACSACCPGSSAACRRSRRSS